MFSHRRVRCRRRRLGCWHNVASWRSAYSVPARQGDADPLPTTIVRIINDDGMTDSRTHTHPDPQNNNNIMYVTACPALSVGSMNGPARTVLSRRSRLTSSYANRLTFLCPLCVCVCGSDVRLRACTCVRSMVGRRNGVRTAPRCLLFQDPPDGATRRRYSVLVHRHTFHRW